MDYLYIIIPAIFLLLILTLIIIFHFKKKNAIEKVCSLSNDEKNKILNAMVEPFGFAYNPCQDIFTSRLDATQKIFGYTTFYDLTAPYFNMVFDYEPIYFDYKKRTWLIEIWKGQYGINSGCELGVYHADQLISPDKYNSTIFKAASTDDMPYISLKLNRHCHGRHCKYKMLGNVKGRHWWKTLFKPGTFSKPEELFVNISITFKDFPMMFGFLGGLKTAMPGTPYKVSGLTVYFTFCRSHRKYSVFKKFVRHISLFLCRMYCKWFNFLTSPFKKSGDKLLYIFYYLPFVSKRICRPKHKKRI